MKPLTHEWVAKAEGDFAIVEREARARKNPKHLLFLSSFAVTFRYPGEFADRKTALDARRRCRAFRRVAREALGLAE